MAPSLRLVLLLGIALYFFCIYYLLIKKSINLKYTLLWITAGIFLALLAVFPQILSIISQLLGIIDITNALFSIILFFTLIILMSLTSIVSKLRNQNRILVQRTAIAEKRIKELEEKCLVENKP